MGLKGFLKFGDGVTIEFIIYGTNFQFIQENKYVTFIWLNSISMKKLNFNLENLLGKNPSCYRRFKEIHFRAVVIFVPRKNAKITTRENNNT